MLRPLSHSQYTGKSFDKVSMSQAVKSLACGGSACLEGLGSSDVTLLISVCNDGTTALDCFRSFAISFCLPVLS